MTRREPSVALRRAQAVLRAGRLAQLSRPLHAVKNGLLGLLSDKALYALMFRFNHGYAMPWHDAQTLNEKIQWLKLNDRRSDYGEWADKWTVRDLVASRIGEEHLVPLLARGARFEDIDWSALGPPFMVKPSHLSGSTRAFAAGEHVDLGTLASECRHWLKQRYGRRSREWQYGLVEPSILVEELLAMPDGTDVLDYKLHCLDGRATFIQVDLDRRTDHRRNLYDRDWNLLPFTWSICVGDRPLWPNGAAVPKPARLNDLIRLSETLAEGFPYVRLDWYVIGTALYFGEATFHPGAGYERILPRSWDIELGRRLVLPPAHRT